MSKPVYLVRFAGAIDPWNAMKAYSEETKTPMWRLQLMDLDDVASAIPLIQSKDPILVVFALPSGKSFSQDTITKLNAAFSRKMVAVGPNEMNEETLDALGINDRRRAWPRDGSVGKQLRDLMNAFLFVGPHDPAQPFVEPAAAPATEPTPGGEEKFGTYLPWMQIGIGVLLIGGYFLMTRGAPSRLPPG